MKHTSTTRKIVLLMFSFLLSQASWGQVKLNLELGPALATNNLSNNLKTGFGGFLSGRFFTSPKFALGLGVGYYTFNTNMGAETQINITPITGMAEYYFGEDGFRIMAGLEAGLFRIASRLEFSNVTNVNGQSNFGLAPKLGVVLEVAPKLEVYALIKYYYIETDFQDNSFLIPNVGLSYRL